MAIGAAVFLIVIIARKWEEHNYSGQPISKLFSFGLGIGTT